MFGKLVDFDLILEEIAGKQFKCMKKHLTQILLYSNILYRKVVEVWKQKEDS